MSHCPACGTPLVRVDGEAAWQCPNKFGCPPQIAGRVEHFVGRKMMNIDGVGEETAQLFLDAGLVSDIADLYDLRMEDMMRLPGFGERSARKVLDSLEASKSVPFDRVVYALSIPFVGDTVAKKLVKAFPTIDMIMQASAEELAAAQDIGPKIAESIVDYFANPVNQNIVARLRAAGVRMEAEKVDASGLSDLLAGKSIVISGTFARHSRDEYKELIERNGGKNVGSISKKTDFVLAGENMGPSKREKATSLGIPLIDETEFLRMIGQE